MQTYQASFEMLFLFSFGSTAHSSNHEKSLNICAHFDLLTSYEAQ